MSTSRRCSCCHQTKIQTTRIRPRFGSENPAVSRGSPVSLPVRSFRPAVFTHSPRQQILHDFACREGNREKRLCLAPFATPTYLDRKRAFHLTIVNLTHAHTSLAGVSRDDDLVAYYRYHHRRQQQQQQQYQQQKELIVTIATTNDTSRRRMGAVGFKHATNPHTVGSHSGTDRRKTTRRSEPFTRTQTHNNFHTFDHIPTINHSRDTLSLTSLPSQSTYSHSLTHLRRP